MADKPKVTEKWYALSTEETLNKLNTVSSTGLSESEAHVRITQYGKNELPEGEVTSLFKMILEQFQDVTVILLIIAALISIPIGEAKDAVVILAIVALNALIGVYQERQAENALASLRKMQTPIVRVRREGHVKELDATELVPGDIVLLEAGDSVPADGRLLEAVNVKVDESAMTGESLAVEKISATQEDTTPPPPLAERQNQVFMGTSLTYGRAEMVVTETGLKTQLGNIASLLQSVEQGRTPLQERLEKMGYWLAGGALLVCLVVFVTGVLREEAEIEEMFLTSVSLAVAAIPEGLPAIITVSLALGANRMVRRHALIRKLPAVETLGSVTVICSDKTGTLTRNEMTVTRVLLPGHDTVKVTGVGYEPAGEFLNEKTDDRLHVETDDQLSRLIKGAALCTDAHLERTGDNGYWHIVGDTTEGALLVMAGKMGWTRRGLEEEMKRVSEIPFTAERKAMTTVHEPSSDHFKMLFDGAKYVSFTKGAPDNLLAWASEETYPGKHVPLTPERRKVWEEQIEKLAAQGIRVLGLGYRYFEEMPTDLSPENIERGLILLGLIGMIDPPRTEAQKAVAVAQGAGIRPVMITGDHKLTAKAIAEQIGIADGNASVVTGGELDAMSPDQLVETVKHTSVYARVSPEHKLRVVEAFQKNGEIVAMTGDGVNDAPALKQANIGVAMGITGTDVSKGAADMVLTDDNFASIVSAVEEGRTIYDNIRKFLRYLIGSNTGEIMTMFGAIVIGLKLPLLATQILWINLVTDGLPAIALGFEPSEADVMKRKPRDPKESIFARGVGIHMLWVGTWMGFASLAGYIWMLDRKAGDIFDPDEEHLLLARSMAFFVLAVAQLFHVSAIHSGNTSSWEAPVWKNPLLFGTVVVTILLQAAAVYVPFMQDLLSTTDLPLEAFVVGFLLAMSIFPAVEVEKWILRRRGYHE